MAIEIEKKLVICVTSSALFDMTESDKVFKEKGVKAYKKFQEENVDKILEKGVAYPFIKRLLSFNQVFDGEKGKRLLSLNPDLPKEKPIEVVLFSKNSPETGIRAMRSIQAWGLDITRYIFTSGKPNFQYLPAYNSALFLSANEEDTRMAIDQGYAAGTVIGSSIEDDDTDDEFRLAFDFDSVLASDESEKFFKKEGLDSYMQHEKEFANEPLSAGPLEPLLEKISIFQRLERILAETDSTYKPILQTAIVTARNAPAHERVLTTLKNKNIEVDQMFFLGGVDKSQILNIMKPHIFFDDQKCHLENLSNIPAVHIPFGIANQLS